MGKPPGAIETSGPLRGFPVWPGLFVGLAVALGLLGLELIGPGADSLARLTGGVLAPAHGVVAFAVVTLLGQAFTIQGSDGALAGRRERLPARVGNGGEALFDDPVDFRAFRDEVDSSSHILAEHRRESGRLGRFVTFAVPLAGFAASVLDRRPREHWGVVGQPLFLNLGESLFVLLLTLSVCHSAEVIQAGWRLLAERVSPPSVRTANAGARDESDRI